MLEETGIFRSSTLLSPMGEPLQSQKLAPTWIEQTFKKRECIRFVRDPKSSTRFHIFYFCFFDCPFNFHRLFVVCQCVLLGG